MRNPCRDLAEFSTQVFQVLGKMGAGNEFKVSNFLPTNGKIISTLWRKITLSERIALGSRGRGIGHFDVK